jgi:hypothetical protein
MTRVTGRKQAPVPRLTVEGVREDASAPWQPGPRLGRVLFARMAAAGWGRAVPSDKARADASPADLRPLRGGELARTGANGRRWRGCRP